ncbi:MAG: helix-turn-helix transcriptional regulator [Oscillospiraceae bacterium]|nr:helix-turn-helix transcriptional regulator [Oscillospiraceae bacterium]
MGVSYKKLWKLLIDREMKKKELRARAGISGAAMAKLGRGANVNVDTLVKICFALDCEISDIMDIVRDERRQAETAVNEREP